MTVRKEKQLTMQGIVTVDDFDSSGNPVRFVLLTDDENKYIIEQGSEGSARFFAKYNRNKVELTGVAREDGKQKIIRVNKLKVLPSLVMPSIA